MGEALLLNSGRVASPLLDMFSQLHVTLYPLFEKKYKYSTYWSHNSSKTTLKISVVFLLWLFMLFYLVGGLMHVRTLAMVSSPERFGFPNFSILE